MKYLICGTIVGRKVSLTYNSEKQQPLQGDEVALALTEIVAKRKNIESLKDPIKALNLITEYVLTTVESIQRLEGT